jgi:SAM-dependent methyltransferase
MNASTVPNVHPAPTVPLQVRERLACSSCRQVLEWNNNDARCSRCGVEYPISGGVIDLRPAEFRRRQDFLDWEEHWSESNQGSMAQRFFSFYRYSVFARTVAWHIDHFFPPAGVFVEAGCGTSETSARIDKRGGERTLVAVDLVHEVVARAHPSMDVRIAADCFRLPFADASVDGLWNVGVMEHFTHDRIDAMLLEFRRVLRPGAPLLLLWPATDSLPQKGLRMVEWFANTFTRRATPLRFHPDEISKLRSSEEGRTVLRRNGLDSVFVDWGLRSLMAFKCVVGARPR